ncbi:3133576c-081c-456e-83e5-973bdd00b594 [Thermothielavioides terrestris]|uniref:DNA polymerase epsilon subunit B n=1 Tax=Thermothielavioides terrestris TaxID=2587410 RepID=A0A3S4AT02_9PEZI|nr:3133576c-081c-456e-83e5-973bdd00b594 [Thermothielavioides terrestris]
MMIIQSPKKSPRKNQAKSPEKVAKRAKPPPPPFFAPKNAGPSSAIPSSSPAFATPAHPLRPFQPPAPAKAAVLPIILPPATLRPLAFRTFTKKHSLTLTSSALQELATFIGRHCGSGWREEGLAEKVLEEVARAWKNCNGGVIVEGTSPELKDILKTLEGNMSGGKILTGPRGGLSRQNSLMLEPTDDADNSNTRLGLRPATTLTRDDSQASFGMSAMDFDEEPDDEGVRDVRRWLKVISAFDQPRYTYNVAKKHFERITSKPSLLPSASHKTEAFRNRYNVIHQRLLRNEAFQTSAVTSARSSALRRGASSMQSHKITPVANLLGRHGTNHMLLGMLVILPTGNLAISDLTGTIALDLSHAVAIPEDSAWFTPGMIVLVDGIYEEEEESVGRGLSGSSGVGGTIGGRFQGFFIGQPPCEKRRVTLGISSERAVGSRMRKLEQRLLRQPALANPDSPGRGRVVIVGELNLDQPRSLQALKKILSLYATDPEGSTPMAFVLAGNFTTHAVMARGGSGGSIEYKEFFDALASTLADFPMLLTTATFVFVPGDNDGWVSAFSGAPPRVFAAANAEAGLSSADGKGGEAIWTSNPSRLSLFGPNHEIVLFRDDMSARLRRSSVRLKSKASTTATADTDADANANTNANRPPGEDAMDLDPPPSPPSPSDQNQKNQTSDEPPLPYDTLVARKLVKTILDQGHLAPFRPAVRPLHWDHAAALHLYPLPTALALVDPSAPPFCLTYEGCHVVNPGAVLVAGRRGVARWVEYPVGRQGRVRECTF